jgi:hypothetical protein
MVPIDLLVIMSAGAVFPYAAEAAWDWYATKRKHSRGANAPDGCRLCMGLPIDESRSGG